MNKAMIILADGFEEIEAISIIDILRRGNVDLSIAGLTDIHITGAHSLKIIADKVLSKFSQNNFDVIILPGGEPGTTNLQNSSDVKELLIKQGKEKKIIAAICAAPRILNDLGLLAEKKATSYPGTKPQMTNCIYVENDVVFDDHILTSRGPGTAMLFAYSILKVMGKAEIASNLAKNMVFNP